MCWWSTLRLCMGFVGWFHSWFNKRDLSEKNETQRERKTKLWTSFYKPYSSSHSLILSFSFIHSFSLIKPVGPFYTCFFFIIVISGSIQLQLHLLPLPLLRLRHRFLRPAPTPAPTAPPPPPATPRKRALAVQAGLMVGVKRKTERYVLDLVFMVCHVKNKNKNGYQRSRLCFYTSFCTTLPFFLFFSSAVTSAYLFTFFSCFLSLLLSLCVWCFFFFFCFYFLFTLAHGSRDLPDQGSRSRPIRRRWRR